MIAICNIGLLFAAKKCEAKDCVIVQHVLTTRHIFHLVDVSSLKLFMFVHAATLPLFGGGLIVNVAV